jgi:hypothetical protein
MDGVAEARDFPASSAHRLSAHGLVSFNEFARESSFITCVFTEMGRRFRNRLLAYGPRDVRFKQLWRQTG